MGAKQSERVSGLTCSRRACLQLRPVQEGPLAGTHSDFSLSCVPMTVIVLFFPNAFFLIYSKILILSLQFHNL